MHQFLRIFEKWQTGTNICVAENMFYYFLHHQEEEEYSNNDAYLLSSDEEEEEGSYSEYEDE